MSIKPKIFIGSSVEGLSVAKALASNLKHFGSPVIWTSKFNISSYTLIDLEKNIQIYEFGVFIFTPDDLIEQRDLKGKSVRDNVLFECGMFIGKHGRNKTFVVQPNIKDFLLPSDLSGLNIVKYDNDDFCDDPKSALQMVAYDIEEAIKKHINEDEKSLMHVEKTTKKSRDELNVHFKGKLNSLNVSDSIKESFGRILENRNYPKVMSVMGENLTNPVWKGVDPKRIKELKLKFDLFGDTPPKIEHLDLLLILMNDKTGNRRFLTRFSDEWGAYMLPYYLRPLEERVEDRISRITDQQVSYLKTTHENIKVSILPGTYVVSLKPHPKYDELSLYIFEFCSVQLLKLPYWLSKDGGEYSLGSHIRKFKWFFVEEWEKDANVWGKNGDVVRCVHQIIRNYSLLLSESEV